MKLKVCGIQKKEQVLALNQCGIDYIGFIFYANSPRCVLNGDLSSEWVRSVDLQSKKVGVFVNETMEHIVEMIQEWGLDYVQLHGNESPEFCSMLKSYCGVIKSFSIGGEFFSEEKMSGYLSCVDAVLFDTLSEKHGGTGKKFDWLLVNWSAIRSSIFISGGLQEDDLDALTRLKIEHPQLHAADVNSRFEISPGIKDLERVDAFFNQIKLI